MSADPIVYCLENLTDYRQFERLASDLMAGGKYPDIEPLGGSNDGGRDALYRSPRGDLLFAYSVRRDWRTKLFEDCERILEEEHTLAGLVFVCTSDIRTEDKSKITREIKDRYGWSFETYDIERIRVMLASPLRHLVAQHPAIFCPPFFPTQGGLSVAPAPDTLIIDHVPADHALATWLANRLSLAGFRTWCHGLAPLVGEDSDRSVRALLDSRVEQYLPVLSEAALTDADFTSRCGAARENLLIPCSAEPIRKGALSSRLQSLAPARFHEGWATGLRDVLACLQGRGIRPAKQGALDVLSLHSHLARALIREEPEPVVSNVFPATVPTSLYFVRLTRTLEARESEELRRKWAFVLAQPQTLLAFLKPPPEVPYIRRDLKELAWEEFKYLEQKNTVDAVKELIWRSLDVACVQAGLIWCEHRRLYYFPHKDNKDNHFVPVRHVDGWGTKVAVTGEMQYSFGERASRFRYQLAPKFYVSRDQEARWWVTLRLYVRVTTCDGKPLEGKDILRRRKKVTKGWWNKHWLVRTLGVVQALTQDGDRYVRTGFEPHQVAMDSEPLQWSCPISIDGEAVDRLGDDFQEELALVLHQVDDEEDEPETAVVAIEEEGPGG